MEPSTIERPLSGTNIGKIESDMFCAGCGYNLHALDVTRDERLGIAIVQCPECGKYHPAGVATGAGRVWLSRLATTLIYVWIWAMVIGVLAFAFLSGVLDVAKIEGFIQYQEFPHPVPGMRNWSYMPIVPHDDKQAQALWLANMLVNVGSLLLGYLAGASLATFLWHLKRRLAIVLAVPPALALAFVSYVYYVDHGIYAEIPADWFAWRLGLQFGLQCAGVALGALIGRVVVRWVLSIVLTSRLLQHVRCLWEVDGKTPPGTKQPAHDAVL